MAALFPSFSSLCPSRSRPCFAVARVPTGFKIPRHHPIRQVQAPYNLRRGRAQVVNASSAEASPTETLIGEQGAVWSASVQVCVCHPPRLCTWL